MNWQLIKPWWLLLLCPLLLCQQFPLAIAQSAPSTLQNRIENANLFVMAGQLDKAEPLFIDIVQRTTPDNPLHTNALIHLLDIAEQQDSPEQASRWVISLLPAFPEHSTEHINLEIRLARHQIALDNFPVVVNRLAPLLNLPEIDRQVPLLVAYALVQLNRYQAASPVIDIALNNHPEPPKPWLELQLNIRWQLQNWPAALKTLQQLLTIEPENNERWQQLAAIYSHLDNSPFLQASLTIAKRLEPDSKLTSQTVALQALNGQPATAAKELTTAISSKKLPSTTENYMRVAALWLQARETPKALDALAKAAETAEDGEPLWLRGRLLLAEERWAEAAADFDKALKLGKLEEPGQVTLLSGYAWWQAEDISKASSTFEKALMFDDTRQQAQDWLNWLNWLAASE